MEIIKGDARNCYAIQELLQGCQAVINAVGQLKKKSLTYSVP
ncbi:Protein of unknown function [Bacillus cytotoxicus]|nr:Protein of unknown function [Bacillus cytotoxicus]